MFLNTEYVILSVLGTVFFAVMALTTWRPSLPKRFPAKSRLDSMISLLPVVNKKGNEDIEEVFDLADCHETAARLAELIHKDGAGAWPPRTNYVYTTWPVALRPYMDIYHEMKAQLPAAIPSLDDAVNRTRIDLFRARHAKLLNDRVDLEAVTQLLKAADTGRWDVFPRDVYNGFYCCIAWHRHAYRFVPLFTYSPPLHTH